MYLASDFNLANLGSDRANSIHIGDTPLNRVTSTKSLGVTIDQRLVWEEHIDKFSKRVSSALSALRQACRHVLQKKTYYDI